MQNEPTSNTNPSQPRDPKDLTGFVRVGWWEWVALPGVTHSVLKAKVDTGATVSALHAEDIEIVHLGGVEFARFRVFPDEPLVEFRLFGNRDVKSSNGDTQSRPVVLLPVEVGGTTFAIECTLTDRTPMVYPMLLGRSALAGRFLIDPAQERIHRKPRPRRR